MYAFYFLTKLSYDFLIQLHRALTSYYNPLSLCNSVTLVIHNECPLFCTPRVRFSVQLQFHQIHIVSSLSPVCMPLSLPSTQSEVSWLGGSDNSCGVKSFPRGVTDKPVLRPLCHIDTNCIPSGGSDKRCAGCGQGSGRTHRCHQMCSRQAGWRPIHVSAKGRRQGKGMDCHTGIDVSNTSL